MKKGDERRVRILETAEKLFYHKGYEATSIQDSRWRRTISA